MWISWTLYITGKSSANEESFTTFAVRDFYFMHLISMVKTFRTVLNRSGESGHLYRVSDPGEKREAIGSFTIKSVVSCRLFTDALYRSEDTLYYYWFAKRLLVC